MAGQTLTTAEILQRFKLKPTPDELQETGRLCTKFMERLNGHKPEPLEIVSIFEGIFNAGRALGAIQCRRTIMDLIIDMDEAPAAVGASAPAAHQHHGRLQGVDPYPPQVLVNAIPRPFCAECAKGAS